MPEVVRPKTCFVSYSSRDRSRLPEVKAYVEANVRDDIDFFVDFESINVGALWEAEILSAIRSADYFVLVWSHDAEQSGWVQREVVETLLRGEGGPQRMLVVRLDATPLSSELAIFQSVDLPRRRVRITPYVVALILGVAAEKAIAIPPIILLVLLALTLALSRFIGVRRPR